MNIHSHFNGPCSIRYDVAVEDQKDFQWKPRRPSYLKGLDITNLKLYVGRITEKEKDTIAIKLWEVVGNNYKYREGDWLQNYDPQLFSNITINNKDVKFKGGKKIYDSVYCGATIKLYTYIEIKNDIKIEKIYIEKW